MEEGGVRFPSPIRFLSAMLRLWRAVRLGDTLVAPDWMRKKRKQVCLSQAGGCYSHRIDQCQKCSCFVGLKASLLTEDCPRGLW